MIRYTVKDLADMSGVSIRTLHYYHKIGLLMPYERNEAGYRLYTQAECLRLQQILFYRELDVPLQQIKQIINQADYNLLDTLESHKQHLQKEKERLDMLLLTVNKTLFDLKEGDKIIKPEDLYYGLNKATAEKYRQQAIEKYGKESVIRSEAELIKLGKRNLKELKNDFDACVNRLFELREKEIKSTQVQTEITQHYTLIRAFWGTSGSEDPQADAYIGLGKLYTQDERFTVINNEAQPEFAKFLCRAMAYFAESSL